MPPGDVDALLSGPRGRRLCLEVAAGLDAEVGRLVLLRELGDGRPAEGWTMRLGASETRRLDESTVRLGDVVSAISQIETDDLDSTRIREALIASVDSARYWQEPDAADQLAGQREVRAALRPIAEAVLASDATRAWAAPRASVEWVALWRHDSSTAQLPSSAAAIAAWGAGERADEERASRERPRDPTASWSGTWWSIPQAVRSYRTALDAMDLVEDAVGDEAATLVRVRGEGRVLEIATAGDWAELCREHPLEVTSARRHDWFRVTGRDGRWVIPDLHRAAEHWDALHLTTLGYLSAATTLIPLDDERATVIGGWAPDCTLWLTDSARESGARERWYRPDQGASRRQVDTRNP